LKEVKVEMELENIYGGDGFERPDTQEVDVYGEKETTEVVRTDLGVPQEKTKKKSKTKEKEISVKTFKRDDDGTPLYPMGGQYGKLWGAMKEAGEMMYEANEVDMSLSGIERVMKSIQVLPRWVRLEMDDSTEMKTDSMLQEMSGRSTARTFYFDYIPECTAEVRLKYQNPWMKS